MVKIDIRKAAHADSRALIAKFDESKNFLSPWCFAPEDMEAFINKSDNLFLLHNPAGGEIMGYYNLSAIIRGLLQQAFLGYAVFLPFNGQGYMSRGLKLLLKYAFRELGLHRLEANIQPGNIPSINLVKHNGFIKEGFSEKYLKINGIWQDHERWAMTLERWEDLPGPPGE